MVNTRAYAAVRKSKDSGREWIPTSTISLLIWDVRKKVKEEEELAPDWAKDNPVVRIAKIKIEEVGYDS